ncbi:unnamed protein product, partial [Laminaria digitata]
IRNKNRKTNTKPTTSTYVLNNKQNSGVGTIIAGFIKCSLETLIVGVLQLLTAAIVVGWVWSILWGWELLVVA